MVFSDSTFLFFFLPAVLSIYWIVGWRFRNPFLVLVGTLFYIWGGGNLIILLAGTIVASHITAKVIEYSRDKFLKKLVLIIFLIAIIGSLTFWKYFNFVLDQVSNLGIANFESLNIVLPIAISFYTFQCISYVVDVYRGEVNASSSIIDFSAYILLFPHLIAGPIVRYAEIKPELDSKSSNRFDDFVDGAPRFFWGLAKKVIVADQISVIVERVFSLPNSDITTTTAWIGGIAFAIQIYFDFSGYSDMAIGLARMFGFTFPENFRRPYSSHSITEFWRRWHISLSSWFRDYVYISLGGNRGAKWKTYRNLFVVFLLTGIWHGANWVFVVWGIFHGALLIMERVAGYPKNNESPLFYKRCFQRLTTFVAVTLGWIIFRSQNLSQSVSFFKALLGTNFEVPVAVSEVLTLQRVTIFLIALLVALFGGPNSIGAQLSDRENKVVGVVRMSIPVIIAPITLVYCLTGTFSPFLYFQF